MAPRHFQSGQGHWRREPSGLKQHDRGRFPLSWRREDKRAVGYASLSVYRDNDAYAATVELSVYVDHEYRGRKIGDALMEELLRIAKENGEVHAIISVITADNAASIRLHEKFGFQFCGITREVGPQVRPLARCGILST